MKRSMFYLLMGVIDVLLPGCHSQPAPAKAVKHLAMVHRQGVSLFVDRVENRMIMKEYPDSSGKQHFYSFLIGWEDSTQHSDAAASGKREKYFQYDMQKDWRGLVKGDSIRPVFFQEKPGLDKDLKQAIIVFESPAGAGPDTLLYNDTYGSAGTAIFVLNRN